MLLIQIRHFLSSSQVKCFAKQQNDEAAFKADYSIYSAFFLIFTAEF
jgi:hypothetical protein